MTDRKALIDKLGYWMQRNDVTGAWSNFVDGVLQAALDLDLADIDRHKESGNVDLVDSDDVIEAMLFDLHNPFDVSQLTTSQKRLLIRGLVAQYKTHGTDDAIREVVSIFTTVNVVNIVRGSVTNGWELGVDVIGDGVHPLDPDDPTDFILIDPSRLFIIYSFMLELDAAPTDAEIATIEKLMAIVKPCYMHYLGIAGIVPVPTVLDWEIGMSEVGWSSDVH